MLTLIVSFLCNFKYRRAECELMQPEYYFYCAPYNSFYRLSCYHLRAKIQEGLGALRKVKPGGGTYMGLALAMVCAMDRYNVHVVVQYMFMLQVKY